MEIKDVDVANQEKDAKPAQKTSDLCKATWAANMCEAQCANAYQPPIDCPYHSSRA